MSSAELAAAIVKELESEDVRILRAFESSMSSFEFVPLQYLMKYTKLHQDQVQFRLRRLHKRSLIVRNPSGYSLVAAGLDALALVGFVKRGLISGMGHPIGIGKEADVFEAISDSGLLYAIKFYRLGRTSFREARRKRGYSSPLYQHSWLLLNVEAAKREQRAIDILLPLRVAVPELLARERHALLMKRIEGTLLAEYSELLEPKAVLSEILQNLRISYVSAGIINADLSEYNILHDGERIWIIDWPQAIDSKHPNSMMLLERDVLNIVKFFARRFKTVCNPTVGSLYVRGMTDRLEIV